MNKWKSFLIVLLAVVCVGGAELAASAYCDPVLYAQVTTPVISGARTAVRYGARAVSVTASAISYAASVAADATATAASALWDSLAAMQEAMAASAELETQLAAEPEEVTAVPVSDPSITEMVETDSQEILTGGVCPIIYFNQGDRQWAELRYGTDYIGRYGCGPTAMAMVVDSLTDEETDPAQMAQFAVDHGYWARSHGSYLSIVEGVCASYGLEAHAISALTEEAIVEELSNGHILVALMGPGHFTQSGHFILLRGVTLSGSILVADPNSVDRSLTEWDASIILDELSGSTSNGAPLWVITVPAG